MQYCPECQADAALPTKQVLKETCGRLQNKTSWKFVQFFQLVLLDMWPPTKQNIMIFCAIFSTGSYKTKHKIMIFCAISFNFSFFLQVYTKQNMHWWISLTWAHFSPSSYKNTLWWFSEQKYNVSVHILKALWRELLPRGQQRKTT